MNEIKTFAPARGFRRGYLLLAILAIILLAINGWVLVKKMTDYLEAPVKSELRLLPPILAGALDDRLADIDSGILTYIEQPKFRTNVDRIIQQTNSNGYHSGFWDAVDASLRSFVTNYPEIKNMTLTDVTGRKITGTGQDRLTIEYPDAMEPIHRSHSASEEARGYLEIWTIPVRDAAAKPIAYIVSEVRPLGSLLKLRRLITMEDSVIVVVSDEKGDILVLSSDETFETPNLLQPPKVELNGSLYFVGEAKLKTRPWKVKLALPANEIMRPVRRITRWYLVLSTISTVLLLLLAVLFAKKFVYLHR